MKHVHTSPYAGTWYPSDACELRDVLTKCIENSRVRSPFVRSGGLAFIVPHAAPIYAGTVAAAVYRHVVRVEPRRIILLGFSHRRGLPGVGVPQVECLETPLGVSLVDTRAACDVLAHAPFHSAPEDLLCDHSVEIQLPFLQMLAPKAKVLPLYVGHLSNLERSAAASRLRWLLDGSTVIIASSDFTHYGREFGYLPFAVDQSTPRRLSEVDAELTSLTSSLDPELFLDEVRRMGATVCGYEPIALMLEILRGVNGEEVFQDRLDYETSGDITGDYSHSVSYAAVGYFPADAFALSSGAGSRLTAAARTALHWLGPDREQAPIESDPELEQNRSVFVTLYQDGELHGCIGCCHEVDSLSQVVPQLAVSAAVEDQRFEPLERFDNVDIEISVLSPFKRVRSAQQLVPGEHGGHLDFGGHAGLLLPKVACEHRWTSSQFLDALAHKAGLPHSIYDQPGFRLHIFRAQVFREAFLQVTAQTGGVQ
jgi:hypothetical protein